jgi:hypothetical protein
VLDLSEPAWSMLPAPQGLCKVGEQGVAKS